MRLANVSVRKYRSIDTLAEFSVGDYTVLLGANNQGKSNLLRATVLAMHAIEGWAALPPIAATSEEVPLGIVLRASRRGPARLRRSIDVDYEWERDYPLFARDRRGAQRSTVIQLDFELSAEEQSAFKIETDISTNARLPVQVTLTERYASLSIPKQGRGDHKNKAREIAAFVSSRIGLLYVPAVRTGVAAVRVAEEILESRRRRVLESDKYAALLAELEVLDAQAVRDVEAVLTSTLRRFLPNTERVTLEASGLSRSRGVEEILVDDGVSTPLSSKGDGVQSLAALGLTLEWTRSNSHPDKQLVVAVEEPESHLHPGAVHELRQVLQAIAATQQVVVTTHSQALINRVDLSRNVIVGDRTASSARTLDQLRVALGVRLSDALAAAEVTVIGEGFHDEFTFRALLRTAGRDVADWIDEGRVLVESAGSGSKIYARVLAARTILTKPLVVIDGDDAGVKDVEKLLSDGIIDEASIVQTVRPDCLRSELKDLFMPAIYLPSVDRAIQFTLSDRERRILTSGRTAAWSERLETILQNRGMPNAASRVKVAKASVNAAVQTAIVDGQEVIREDCRPSIDRLIQLIRANVRD